MQGVSYVRNEPSTAMGKLARFDIDTASVLVTFLFCKGQAEMNSKYIVI